MIGGWNPEIKHQEPAVSIGGGDYVLV